MIKGKKGLPICFCDPKPIDSLMMDFARKQLEKYGWSDGKGLGKHENGISQPLKPKLKRSVTGIGHDAASDFTEHWWSALYDKAAGNVEVKEKNGKTKKIKTKDSSEFEITNSTWRLNKKHKEDGNEQYKDYFVRTAILSNDGVRTKKVRESASEDESETRDVHKMTDEELFAACEGRTAHKGARHGLKALGKLARIAQQEEMLLSQPQYNGYSHSKNKTKHKLEQVVEEMNLNADDEVKEPRKKKKKKKRCSNEAENNQAESEGPVPEKTNLILIDSVASVTEEPIISKKTKKSKSKHIEVENEEMNETISKSKKKKRKDIDNIITLDNDVVENSVKSKKNKFKSAK